MRANGTPWWAVGEPGIPEIASLEEILPKRDRSFWPARPYQLACNPATAVGWAVTAGVHSTVWILASSAELTSRAFWKSCSSSSSGWALASMSQMALCSRAKSVVSIAIPSQNPGTRAGLRPGSYGIGGMPSCMRSRPPSPDLRNRCCSRLFP